MRRRTGSLVLVFLAMAACASPQVIGVPVSLAEFRVDEEDAILPVRITHPSEQMWNGNTLEQNYNYLVYEFETEEHLYRARAYLDDIQTVSIHGPFDRYSSNPAPLAGVEIDPRVIAYLRRRYAVITVLGPTGYVPLE